MVLGMNPPASLCVASLHHVLIQLHSEAAPLESVSQVLPGSNSPYHHLPANSARAPYVRLDLLCFHASLPAAEDLASGHKMGRQLQLAALQRPGLASRPSRHKDLSKLPSPLQGQTVTRQEGSEQGNAAAR